MLFLGTLAKTMEHEIIAAAEALSGAQVTTAKPLHGGANNRVYKVETQTGPFALKVYPHLAEDLRDRLGAEFDGLTFLNSHNINGVPKAIACDRNGGLGLYEWIEGEAIVAPGVDDIDAAADFVQKLKVLSQDVSAIKLPLASEACLSGAEIVSQIKGRLDHLGSVGEDQDQKNFLEIEFVPFFEKAVSRARNGYQQAGWNFDSDIVQDQRTLSPSDFGFHNALKVPSGEVVFIDFEYFGWDDPVRLVADFILHPGMTLNQATKNRFARRSFTILADDDNFRLRLDLLFPLVGLRWAMILLNEFIPERWRRRSLAGAGEDMAVAQMKQLEKAHRLLKSLKNPDKGLFYDN